MREQFRVLLLGTIVLPTSIFSSIATCAQDDDSNPQFVPRTDANAASDLKSLRFELSRIRDSAGNIDPLANYAKAPRSTANSTPPPASDNRPELPTPSKVSGPAAPAASEQEDPNLRDENKNDLPPNGKSEANPSDHSQDHTQKESIPRRTPVAPANPPVGPANSQSNRLRNPPTVQPAGGPKTHQFRVLSPGDSVVPCGPRIVWESCVQLDKPAESSPQRIANLSNQKLEPSIDVSTSATLASTTLNIGKAKDRLATTGAFSEPLQDLSIANNSTPTRIILSDGFSALDYVPDPESRLTPRLASSDAVVYASAHLSVANPSDYIANFQEIPFGSQGTPVLPMPTLPTTPNLPTSPGVYPPGAGGVYPTVPSYPPPTYIPPATSIPPTPVYPPIDTQPMAPGIPLTQQPAQTLPAYPAPVFVAPAPYYVPSPIVSTPVQTPLPTYTPSVSPLASNSGTQLPTYSLEDSSIVNFKPFVSGPPRQVDSRRMVSPTLFRPAASASCNVPCGSGQPGGYAPPAGTVPGAGPMTYAPPVYMPYQPSAARYAGYRSLIGFGQDISQAQIGRGVIGQPTAYIPNQPVRNFFRYIFP